MTKQKFNTIKTILNLWLILIAFGSVVLMIEDDFIFYTIQLGLVVLNFWFINQFNVKGEPETKIDVEIK